MRFSSLFRWTARLGALLLLLIAPVLAALPPLKLPVASYYSEPSPPGFLSGGRLFDQPTSYPSGPGFRSSVLEDYQLQSPHLHSIENTDAKLWPVPGGKVLKSFNYVSGGYSYVRLSTHATADFSQLSQRDLQFAQADGVVAVHAEYALVRSWNHQTLNVVPLLNGPEVTTVELADLLPFGGRIETAVAASEWFAVGITDPDDVDALRWHVFRKSDSQRIGEFRAVEFHVWNGLRPTYLLGDRYIAMVSLKQVQIWDVENLAAGPQILPAPAATDARFEDAATDGEGLWTVVATAEWDGPREVRYFSRNASGLFEITYRATCEATSFQAWNGRFTAEGSVGLYQFHGTGRTLVYERSSSAPLLSMSQSEWADEASGKASFLLTLDEPAKQACGVRVIVRSGTATAGQDFQARDFRVTFAPGEQSVKVEVALVKDLVPENHETILVDLLEPEGLKLVQTGNLGLVIRASGFELDQQRVFSGIPDGWEKPRVHAVLQSYVIATLQKPAEESGYIPGFKLAAFDLKNGGFIGFADFNADSSASWSETNEVVGALTTNDFRTEFQLVRWNPRGGSGSRVDTFRSGAGWAYPTSHLIWAGGEKLVGVATNTAALTPGTGTLSFHHLSGVELDGKLPNQAWIAVSNHHLAVVAVYGDAGYGSGVVHPVRAHLFDRTTLAKLWSVDLGPTEESELGVKVSKDHVVASLGGRLVALDIATGAVAWDRTVYPDDPERLMELKAVSRSHAFFTSEYNGPLEVMEVSTGMYLGLLEVGELFEANVKAYRIFANENGAFVGRGSNATVSNDFLVNAWVELKSERTRPALVLDPPVLAVSYDGTPVFVRAVEGYDRPIQIELGNGVRFNVTVNPPLAPGWTSLTIPPGGTGVGILNPSPATIDGWNGLATGTLTGRILSDGQVSLEEFTVLPAVVAVPAVARKTQLAVGVDFSGAEAMVEVDGQLIVGFPGAIGDARPGSGKVEVFDAKTGSHLRTILRPAKPVAVAFGKKLLVQQGKLLIGAPGWIAPKKPEKAKKTGTLHVAEIATGNLLASLANPGEGVAFGSELASNDQYFAASALNPNPGYFAAKGTVAVFRWSDFKKAAVVKGDAFARFGASLALNGGELLVGAPNTTLLQATVTWPEAGRVQSFVLPQAKPGADWFSPWLSSKGRFGSRLLTDGSNWVSASVSESSAAFQIFDSPRGNPRFLLQPLANEAFRMERASLHQGRLVLTRSNDLLMVSLQDGEVPLENRVIESSESNYGNFPYTLDAGTNLNWIEGSRLYRADAEDLGGFAWWSKNALPQTGAVNAEADANRNGIADLRDYLTDRAGNSPLGLSYSSQADTLTATVSSAIPKDVCLKLEVMDQEGDWRQAGIWAGGVWVGDDFSQGVIMKPSWSRPVQYRVIYVWLGRGD